MSPFDLIDHLEKTGVLTTKVAGKLRKQVQAAGKGVSAQTVVTQLVKKGLLDESRAKSALAAIVRRTPTKTEELGLMPEDETLELVDLVDTSVSHASATTTSRSMPPTSIPTIPTIPTIPVIPVEIDPGSTFVDSVIETSDVEAEQFASAPTKRARRRPVGNRWDSPLMLVGGGSLILLLILGTALWFFLSRGPADESFKLAEEDYRAENFIQAVTKFQTFANDYPTDEKASLARVRIALARILTEISQQNWLNAFNLVRTELPTIGTEDAFDQARPELASILPNIMRGFAEQAQNADNVTSAEQQLKLAQDTLGEINNGSYLPTRLRSELQPRIDSIEAIMKTVERRINRDKELALRLTEIEAAIGQSDTTKAYAIHRNLLKLYPVLEENDQLREAIQRTVAKDREQVTLATKTPTPITDDYPRKSQFSVVLASRRGDGVAGLDGVTAFVLARGSVFGLKAGSGEILWRRFVGFETTVSPVPLSNEAGADVLVVDSRSNELLRLTGDTGRLKWRLPCAGSIAAPTLEKNQILISCDGASTGTLLLVDAATGSVLRAAQFPMTLNAPAVRDAQASAIYQVGIHSSLFVLNTESFACTDAAYLGHSSGSIVVPPVVVMNHVLVAENPAPNFSLLHILAPDSGQDGRLRSVMKPIRLSGQVLVPMIAFGKRVLVTTVHGGVDVFEVDPRNRETPLAKAVEGIVPNAEQTTLSFPYLEEGMLWLADAQLSRFDLQASRGALVRKWIREKDDMFLSPLQRIGDLLIHVRQRKGKRGATVSAVSIESDGQPIWETDLGVPPAAEAFVSADKQNIGVMSANGELYLLGKTELQSKLVDRPQAQVLDANSPVLDHAINLGAGRLAYFDNRQLGSFVLYDPSAAIGLRQVPIDLGNDKVTSLPIAFDDKLLVSTASGSVFLVDPTSGKPAALEFQPALTLAGEETWPQAAFDSQKKQAILSDGKHRLFKLELAAGLQPRLNAVIQADSDIKPHGQLAILGESVFAVQDDEIVSFRATDLKSASERWPLTGQVDWGPEAIGKYVFISTDMRELFCLNDDRKQVWKSQLPHGPLSGPPVLTEIGFAFASMDGFVWFVDAQSGEVKHSVELNESLGTGPVQFGNHLIILGADGTLHVVSVPRG